MGEGPKRHHYVPQAHLRAFSVDGEGKQVWVFDKGTGNTFKTAIENAAVQADYYSIPTEAGKDRTVEHTLTRLEADGARVLELLRHALIGDLLLERVHREWLASYVALQHVRVPTQREQFHSFANFASSVELDILLSDRDAFLQRVQENNLGWPKAEAERNRRQWLRELRSGELTLLAPEQSTLLPMMQGVLEIMPVLLEMGWWVLKRFEPLGFVIGDAPVTLWTDTQHPHKGIGFGTPGVEVAMPLSADTVVIGAKFLPVEKVRALTEAEHVLQMNARTWLRSTRFIYAAREEDLVATRDFLGDAARETPSKFDAHVGPPEWREYAKGATFRAPRQQSRRKTTKKRRT